MHVTSVQLRNFRCFTSLALDFKSSIVLITGPNGSGKTSILEALHFICYLRSFKTHITKELIHNSDEGFSIIASIASPHALDTLQVSITRHKRLVKLNQKPLYSFKELYTVYKAITITEDDLLIVRGAPAVRRSFIDQMLVLQDPSYALLLRKYRHILDNRNALLSQFNFDKESYVLWTSQLLAASKALQEQRQSLLVRLEKEASALAHEVIGPDYGISIPYLYARPYTAAAETAQELLERYPSLIEHERAQRRSLFGAHLDDFSLIFQQKESRTYASRGQQKLIVFLLKLAQAKLIHNHEVVFLVDDFMADFDEAKASVLLPLMIRLSCQVIMTFTFVPDFLQTQLSSLAPQYLSLQSLESID